VRIRHPTDADTPEYRGGTSTEVQRPANERERLAALRRFEIVDTPEEEAFDRITRLAAAITGAPRAAIGLLDEDRLWFKSGVGVGRVQVARNGSFAAYAILESGVMVVEDALADPRFCDHAFVAGPPHYRFYAGAPIVTRDGFSLGALSVLDTRPRGLPLMKRAPSRTLQRLPHSRSRDAFASDPRAPGASSSSPSYAFPMTPP
jgi:GAF domain-containing protein